MTNPEISNRVLYLSCRTDNAYMYDQYGEERWCENIAELVRAGYTDEAIEWIVRSKIARWADNEGETMLLYIRAHVGDAKLRDWMRD
jgi:hypothetical protein